MTEDTKAEDKMHILIHQSGKMVTAGHGWTSGMTLAEAQELTRNNLNAGARIVCLKDIPAQRFAPEDILESGYVLLDRFGKVRGAMGPFDLIQREHLSRSEAARDRGSYEHADAPFRVVAVSLMRIGAVLRNTK